jgi:hypothetical protein
LIIGNLPKAKGKGVRKVEVGTATGPASAVSVPAGSTADFTISISSELENVDSVKVTKISGLPANVLAVQVDWSATSVTLRAVNPTASAITIAAGSITITYELIGW